MADKIDRNLSHSTVHVTLSTAAKPMRYLYYPGCSLEGTAVEYDLATRALMQTLDIDVIDVAGWTCCGATAASGVSRLLALSLAARNLALAEAMHSDCDLLVPCSACYLNLQRAAHAMREEPQTRAAVNRILADEHLSVTGTVRVRHILDVLARDVGADTIASHVRRPLNGQTIAPYYGCQCLRPYAVFDDPQAPDSMSPLIRAVGAEVLPWTMGPKCCGGAHMTTHMHAGMDLTGAILAAAKDADAIATVCPMCQINLDGFQKKIARHRGAVLETTVVYLPQLLGLAMGLGPHAVGLQRNLSVTASFKNALRSLEASV
jgi:heterodisulfide reductase subunit B